MKKTFAETLFDDMCDLMTDHFYRLHNITPSDAEVAVSFISSMVSWANDHNIPTDETYTGYGKLTDLQAMIVHSMEVKKGPKNEPNTKTTTSSRQGIFEVKTSSVR